MKSIHTIISHVHAILNGKRNESPATNQTENLWKKCFSRMAGVLAVCLLFGGSCLGQSSVTIGTGTTSSNIPFTTYYNSQISEQIYLSSEINTGGPVQISSIAFYSGDLTTAANTTPIIRIWMKSASAASLSNGSYDLTGYYLVYDGGFTITANAGWKSITLQTPYNYNGTSNLHVLVEKSSAYASPYRYFNASTTAANMNRYYIADTYAINSISGVSGTATSLTAGTSRPNIQISYISTNSESSPLTFNSSSTWTAPTGVCWVNVVCFGAGGAGGTEANNASNRASGGGGGGAYASTTNIAVTPGTTYTITVGEGGKPSFTASANGGNGGNSSFGSAVVAAGGSGGFGNSNGLGGSGGVNTSPTVSGNTARAGGAGAPGVNGTAGGGGGSSAGTSADGNPGLGATAGSAPIGGVAGGNGNTSGKGVKGLIGGGGGGGARQTGGVTPYIGGVGGSGKVTLTWSTPLVTTAPVVSPICAGATTISGTSTEDDNTSIEIFNASTSLGTTTVTSGAWTKSGLTALASGASITAKATAPCKTVSAASAAVTVQSISTTPAITGAYCAGETTVSGTGVNGASISVIRGGSSIGTATVGAGGTWSATVSTLAASDILTATQTESGKCESPASSSVTVDACTTPLITLSATSLSAFTSCANSASATATFTVSGANLGANNLTVTPPSGFEISSDGGATSYVNSTTSPAYLTFTPSTGTVSSQTITVRMMAQSSSPTASTISCASTGATTKTVSVSGTVNPLPTATWAANATSVCYSSSAQNTPVAYTATTNTPTSYSITWNSTPTNSFVAVTNQSNTFTSAGAAGTLSIAVPAGATANTYTGTITVKNANSCVSASSNFTVTITALPANPANPESNSPQCVTSGVTLTANGSTPSGEAWYWQTGSTGTSTTSSASTYTVTTSNTYYIRSQVAATGCWSTGAGSLAVTVNPLPTALVLTGSTVCSGVTTTISSSTSVSGINYQLFNSSNAIVGSTVAGTGSALTWSGTAAGTGYYVIGTNATTTCSSAQSNAVNIVVNALPASPGNPTSNSPQCFASGVTLTANGSAPSGETWYWQTGSTGTSTTSSASTYSVTVTGTYYIRSRNNTSTCWSSAAGSQDVVVNAAPSISTQPSASTQAVCQNGTLTSLSVSATAGSGTISAYQWYSNTTSSTSGGTSVAGTNSTYTPQSSSAGTLYYYVTITNSNGCSTTSSVSGAVTVSLQMSGTYSVGAGGNYATLTAAVTAINSACMTGPVTFNLTAATYSISETFPIIINANSSASASNTLTIKPASGVTATISGSAATSALIKIASKYVTIDGSNTAGGTTRDLTITNTSTTTPNVILIGNSGTSTATALTDVTLKNAILINGVNTSTAVIVANNLAAAGYFNNITIQNNSVQKAYIGIYALATVATGNGSGLLITGNDLNTSGANAITNIGIYVQGVDGATVSNNNIGNITSSAVSPMGIWFATATNSGSISGNTISTMSYTGTSGYAPSGIYLTSGTTATSISVSNNTISGLTSSGTGRTSGIYTNSLNHTIFNNTISNIKNTNSGGYLANGIFLASTSTTANITLYNNFIFDIAGYGYSSTVGDNGYGIVLYSGGGYNLYNNTINMNTNQTTGYSAAVYISSSLVTAASVNIRNNIFANTQTAGANAGKRFAIYCAAANTIFGTIDHNDYYSSGTHLGYIGSNRTTLADVVTGFGGNANSISALPSFTSATDLHLTTSGNCSLNNAGTPISGFTTDYDGDTRSLTVPDIGADEFTGSNTAAAASSTPTLCINTALTNITHVSTGATGISNSGVSGGNGLPTGVSAAWTSNTITISGTPTASGTFNYSIPLTGGCGNGSATGTITVTAANTAAAASSTPTLCISTALTNITHATTGATGIGTATSLPAGVSATWASDIITISGTPSASGTFNYIIPLTGGCGGINATGTITVTTNTAAAASAAPTLCISTALTNITHATTDATGISNSGVSGGNGLPAGVSATWASDIITISGTPTASGVFGYSIPLTGGCGSVNATGTITVSPTTVAGTISAASSSVCSGTGTTLSLSGNTGTIEWQSSTDNVTYGTISGATSSSLSTGNLTQAKYFKALVSSGTCSAASTSVQVITIYANGTYIGPSTGNWNDAANWCGGLPSNATNVVISSGDVVTLNINAETTVATMTIDGSLIVPSTAQFTVIGLLTNNGTFTLKDGATFIQGTSGTSITGNGTFNVEKALADNSSTWTTTSGRFWYMGVPMVNVVRSGYGQTGTTTNRVWSYAESTKSYTELTDGNALLSAGTGYVHRRSTDGTITFSASGADGLYRSDVNMSGLTRTTGTSAGYHLVSNPYMAYLDWYSVTKTNIEPTFYIRTNNTTNSNISALISYNSETSLSTNTSSVTATTAQLRYIAPLQSIWVRVGTAASTGSLAMTRGILSHQIGNVGLKSSTVFPALARVNLVDGNNFDQLLVYLNSDMSNEVDQYDSEKMLSSGTVQMYTMSSNKKLVMNGLKNNKKKVSVPLYLELPETKSYTLQLSEYMMEDGLILLEDKQEGTIQDFTINENYSFFANSGLLQNRFVLHFILPNAEITTQGPSNSWVAEEGSYTEGGDVEILNDDRGNIQITLNQAADLKVEGTVSATDMNGKAVYTGQLEGITTNIELNVPSGIYYLTVQSGTLIEKKKVFIQN